MKAACASCLARRELSKPIWISLVTICERVRRKISSVAENESADRGVGERREKDPTDILAGVEEDEEGLVSRTGSVIGHEA
jgi:hypothetical protein